MADKVCQQAWVEQFMPLCRLPGAALFSLPHAGVELRAELDCREGGVHTKFLLEAVLDSSG